ncbi:MAG TPA: L,D-transpeptidase [Lamprocystis sp. (in: g-proteobacteria)]|nr:L,D-transpeptidase [Lamprocystis sp. (in: g-proteobacteria)]
MTKAELQEQIATELGIADANQGLDLVLGLILGEWEPSAWCLAYSVQSMTSMALCLCLGLLGAGCGPRLATKADNVAQMPNPMFNANYPEDAGVPFVLEPRAAMTDGSGQANFESESASRRARDMADWVVSSRDNLDMPFAIVDKVNAKVYVFGVDGQLQGAAPVLLGLAQGNYAAPGVGDMRMSRISPAERTTPAGRFVANMGRNSHGKEILWVDYEHAISLHPVVTGRPEERRAQRLDSPSPLDNRISYGCINVPAKFFKNVIHGTFAGTVGIVYVLPETSGAG